MNRLIDENRVRLEQICRERHVQRIELFGSATGPDFDPATSDLDFLVTFEELPLNSYADVYFGLQDDLQKLFHRSVDLIVESSIRNPYFRQAVDSTRTLVYAA
jgi:predicted nucleotidyltransferase